METYELKARFKDGHEVKLKGVSDYGIKNDFWYAIKNGYKIFFNPDEVVYMGRVFDIENGRVGEING